MQAPKKTANKQSELDVIGVAVLFICFFCLFWAADQLMRQQANSFLTDLETWRSERAGQHKGDLIEYLGIQHQDANILGRTRLIELALSKQISDFERASEIPAPEALKQAVRDFSLTEQTGVESRTAASLGDRLVQYQTLVMAKIGVQGCASYLRLSASRAGNWAGICYDLNGPTPAAAPLGRIYMKPSGRQQEDMLEVWLSVKKNIPWLVTLIVWINIRAKGRKVIAKLIRLDKRKNNQTKQPESLG